MYGRKKKELKDMSKKEIAEEMFGEGAYIATKSIMQALKHEVEQESKIESKTKK